MLNWMNYLGVWNLTINSHRWQDTKWEHESTMPRHNIHSKKIVGPRNGLFWPPLITSSCSILPYSACQLNILSPLYSSNHQGMLGHFFILLILMIVIIKASYLSMRNILWFIKVFWDKWIVGRLGWTSLDKKEYPLFKLIFSLLSSPKAHGFNATS